MYNNFYLDRKLSESQDKTQDANQEFVSEDFESSAVSMDDIRREIEQLTVTKKGPNKTNPAKAGSPGELYLLIFTYKYSFLKI
jgi:hypothetical protein